MGNKKVSKHFNDDFKKMVVDLYHTGSSVKDLSVEYGVSEVTIYKWIKKLSPVELEDGTSATPDDFVQIQKQLRRLQEENEILKKAMAIFAKKSV
jgi:transposase